MEQDPNGERVSALMREEMRRELAWRARFDRTTSWAVVLCSALLTWSFAREDNPHYVLLLGMGALGMFLAIEARRYREFDGWRSRVRLLERNVVAPMLDPDIEQDEGWREQLARDYRDPALKIGRLEAVRRRLRRVYIWLIGLLAAAWILRITAFAEEGALAAARLGRIPGPIVVGVAATVLAGLILLAAWPLPRRAMGGWEERTKGSSWEE